MPAVVRFAVGILLLIGGVLGALPILGFWMVPLGLLVLSWDFRWARRGYLGIVLWARRRRDLNMKKGGGRRGRRIKTSGANPGGQNAR
ncbi:MAG: hypothetical protein MPK11_08400 [Gammaproteobacteria bacterium]|nr:hypothetical protein [Gammaproteobacteria bacterium]MDA7961821.1 hypothetical protein [Gammaproteobacteria bacterium]MDA7970771.1 hypothetical protein [Gammaproteobacteria bacterium]MDA7972298.1 hypothetical protein [Gammaproteobacteria bacterium]MDA7995935.1 hypothetical protein [Gammaproteobacteria bacterium]